ncbi:Cof-type HAD-IIB family hydrolase [Pontibacillus yanchengensis]|uniref:Cof-type HAD-IIB family hydrolase n=2 Tax=Pontibacillus yanchengensis TaxID=462910 RepID=A0ACC7VJM0_9BACI|nr:HAD family hydrolase [Pontibacillus yanchengensis]MYL35280.1 Cof-type HAD-IIB family hydrolase [Pontibacillus yanchengensis]MYL54890.1 Cof-type HAD-IIB family hydrolase [Pontibacillus yanchengensis]
MIKLLAIDLDGTLLTMEKQVNEHDIDAIQHAMSSGVDLAIATGRMDHEIKEVLKLLKQENKGHRVSQNGAFVYDKDDKFIHANTFSPEHIQDIFSAAVTNDVIPSVSTETDTYVIEKTANVREMEKRLFYSVHATPDLKEQLGKSIHPSKISIHGANNRLQKLQETINSSFSNELDSFISDPNCLDLMPKNISKGAAIQQLISLLGIEPEEVACMGDSFNDVSMFELTPHSFAMEQAPPEVKEKTSHVVSGVDAAIAHLFEEGLL